MKTLIHWFIFSIILVNIFVFPGCLTDSNDEKSPPDFDIVIGTISDISGFYPWMGIRDNPTLAINVNLFDCLVELDHYTYKFIPALAENWNNPNSTTWRFFLRKDVRFHNGDTFTADDVKFTIDFMKNDPYYIEELEAISDSRIRDTYTIDIFTSKPCPTLLYNLATLFMLSEEHMNQSAVDTETWPVGTGAYQFVDYIPRDAIIFERFDEYWGGPPAVHRVVFKHMNTTAEIKHALLQGEIDIGSLAIEDVGEIQNSTGCIVQSVQMPSVIYLSFDFRVNDSYGFQGSVNPVSDVRVRKAMYHAIDIDTIIRTCLNGSAMPASQFLTSYTFGYNPDIRRLSYDVSMAQELLKDAGYEAGFAIVLDTSNTPRWVAIANEIARQLAEINITILINPLPTDEYYPKLYVKNTSLYITGFNPLDAESLIKLLLQTSNMTVGDGVWNYGNYSNPEVDRLYELLFSTMETWKRQEYLQEIFSIAVADVAWVPLFSPKVHFGMKDEIQWRPSPSSFYWVKDISFTK